MVQANVVLYRQMQRAAQSGQSLVTGTITSCYITPSAQPLPTSRHSKDRNCVKYFLDIQNIKCKYRQNSYLTPFIEFDCRADIFSVYYSLVRTFMGPANSATRASGVWRGGGQVRSTRRL